MNISNKEHVYLLLQKSLSLYFIAQLFSLDLKYDTD